MCWRQGGCSRKSGHHGAGSQHWDGGEGVSELQNAQVLWAGDLGISSISLMRPRCPHCSYATCGPVTHSEVLQLCHPCGHDARVIPWKLNIRSTLFMVSVDLSVVFMLWIPFPYFLRRKARAMENKDVKIDLHLRDTCF